MAASLTNDPALKKSVSEVAWIASSSVKISEAWQLAKLGVKEGGITKYAAAATTLGALQLGLDLYNSQQNQGRDPLQVQLEAISRQIDALRTEMHDRFDRVDAKLNTILARLSEGFGDLRRGINNLGFRIEDVASQIEELRGDVLKLGDRVQGMQVATIASKLTNITQNLYRGYSPTQVPIEG